MPSDIDQRIPALEEVERTLATISGLQVTLKQTNPAVLRTSDLPLCVLSYGAGNRTAVNQQISSFSQIASLDCIAYLQAGASTLVVENFVKVFAAKIDSIANVEGRPYVLKLLEIDPGVDPGGKLPSIGFGIQVDIGAQ